MPIHMKVLIVGSCGSAAEPLSETSVQLHHDDTDEKLPREELKKKIFDSVSKALGYAFSSDDHTVIVNVPEWDMLWKKNTVANFVIEGCNEVPKKKEKKHEVILFVPEDCEKFDNKDINADSYYTCLHEYMKMPNINIQKKNLERGYKAMMIPNLKDADVVVLVCGGDGTASIGYAAYAMNKPCIALSYFGGAAEIIESTTLTGSYKRLVRQGLITDEDISVFHTVWSIKDEENKKIAEDVVDVAEKLLKAFDSENKISKRSLYIMLGGIMFLLFLWIFIYFRLTLPLFRCCEDYIFV